MFVGDKHLFRDNEVSFRKYQRSQADSQITDKGYFDEKNLHLGDIGFLKSRSEKLHMKYQAVHITTHIKENILEAECSFQIIRREKHI